MKNFHVILDVVSNPSRDVELEKPETKSLWFDIDAETEEEALNEAKERTNMSVLESTVYPND